MDYEEFGGFDGGMGSYEDFSAPPIGLSQPPAPMARRPPLARPVAHDPPSVPAPLALPDSMAMHGLGVVQETVPTSHLLGLSLLLPTVGTLAGLKYGGALGGLGGALAAGSGINAYRAARFVMQGNAEADREAMISGTYAVIGLGVSAWLLYKGVTSKGVKARANEEDAPLRGVE